MFSFWPSVVKPLLDAARAARVIEIGAGEGQNSLHLARWARERGARVHVVDPEPGFDMERLGQRFPGWVSVHREPSLAVLERLLPADAVLIDGDHNWYTVYRELAAIYGTAGAPPQGAPIAVCHDVEWPYGRRDLYYAPGRIPAEHRQPSAIGGLTPMSNGLSPTGLNGGWCHALQEGGPRNGVRTAIEDALAGREAEFRTVWLPMLHGLAIIVPRARLLACPELGATLDGMELGRHLRALCRVAELDRVQGVLARSALGGLAPPPPGAEAEGRSFRGVLPEEVLAGLLKGSLGYRYKGRAMLLNPLDLANYLALLGTLRPAAAIEIGTREGGRALWLADTMQTLGLTPRVIAIDLRPPPPLGDARIDLRGGDARDLSAVLPPQEVRDLGHPLLVIEDSAHDEETSSRVLEYFDPLLAPGDYLVVEDGVFRDASDRAASPSDLSPPSRALAAFLARRGDAYAIDSEACDRFGYNATFNPNGWLRRR